MFYCIPIIVGLTTKRRWLNRTAKRCPRCNNHTLMKTRIDHIFSFFFIPLFPVHRGKSIWICRNCGYMDQVGPQAHLPPPHHGKDKKGLPPQSASPPGYYDQSGGHGPSGIPLAYDSAAMEHCGGCGRAIGASSWRFCPHCGWQRPV